MPLIIPRSPEPGLPEHDYFVTVVVRNAQRSWLLDLPQTEAEVAAWIELQARSAYDAKKDAGLTEEDKLRRPGGGAGGILWRDDEHRLEDAARVEADHARQAAPHALRELRQSQRRSAALANFFASAAQANVITQKPLHQAVVEFDADLSDGAANLVKQAYSAVKAAFPNARDA